MMREPIVAGQFYRASAVELRKEVRSYLEVVTGRQAAIGAMVPHAGYIYSGHVAGAVYSRVEPAECYIILGPNHTGLGAQFSVMARGIWRTPLGEVEIDDELAAGILAGCKSAEEDHLAHLQEHSIEVQLPFLQEVSECFRFVPIVVGEAGLREYRELGRSVAEAVKASKKRCLVLASSDMTHYETAEAARKKDDRALAAIQALDEKLLVDTVREGRITMCGCAAVAVMLAAAKELGVGSAKLVRYATSGERSGDKSSVVGYAGVIIV